MLPYPRTEYRAWTPQEIIDSINTTVENLQRQATRFSEYVDFSGVGHTYVIVPETALGFLAHACFDRFDTKLSQFFETRVPWQGVMSYHVANGSARVLRATYTKDGNKNEQSYWTTDLRSACGEYLQLGEGNAHFYGWDLSSLSDGQRREVYATMLERKYPDSWNARQRRAARENA